MSSPSPIEPVDSSSPDVVAGNVALLKGLFPEIVVDGKVDFDTLHQLLGSEIDDSEEKFGLNWHGKRRARQLALTPSTGTLRPDPEDSVDWDTTQHLIIEGDNLEVLKLLQKSYAGQVKLIYIDPPYNTGSDLVYKDDFTDNIGNYLEVTGQSKDGRKLSTNIEASGRFHTDWLNMMYPRLKLARQLLRDDGVMFISIADEENHHLRRICDELLGEENFIEAYVWTSTFRPANLSQFHRKNAQYVLCYTKNKQAVGGFSGPEIERTGLPSLTKATAPRSVLEFPAESVHFDLPDGHYEKGDRGGYELLDDVDIISGRNAEAFRLRGNVFWTQQNLEAEIASGTIIRIKAESFVPYSDKGPTGTLRPTKLIPPDSVDDILASGSAMRQLMGDNVFSYPKPVSLIRHIMRFSEDPEAIVADFFAGSGTTGHAVMAQNAEDGGNRRYILVQLPEPLDPDDKDQRIAAEFCDKIGKPRNIAELTKERLRRAAAEIREDRPDYEGDLGFRMFQLDYSNVRAWDPRSEGLEERLLEHVDHLKDDRSEQDVLYELLLKLGLDLCVPIETETIVDKTVHSIGAGTLFACLDATIEGDLAEGLALGIVDWRDQLDPAGDTTVVFRDSAFPDDVTKTNLDAILKQHDITTVRSI